MFGNHLLVLAIVQGITEFLPISSSAHLVLLPQLTKWQDQGLVIDVALHVGTLFAVILYNWHDIWNLFMAMIRFFQGRKHPQKALLGQLILASIPVIIAGYVISLFWPKGFRGVELIAWTTVIFGLLLYVADKAGLTVRRVEHMDLPSAMIIGFAQILALFPGTSRSGITITAARVLGFERQASMRFSMLLSIPVILGAGTLQGWELYQSGDALLTSAAFKAAGFAFVAALIAIAILMRWLKRWTFKPFVAYRLVLGVLLLIWIYKPFGFNLF